MAKLLCGCGNKVDKLISFFRKGSGERTTCCENCAVAFKLTGNENYESFDYNDIKKDKTTIDTRRDLRKTV